MCKFRSVLVLGGIALVLGGCGGGGGSSTPSSGATVSGISTPSSVSVVTAN